MKTFGLPRVRHDFSFLSTTYAAGVTLCKERGRYANTNCYAGRISKNADMQTDIRSTFRETGTALRRRLY